MAERLDLNSLRLFHDVVNARSMTRAAALLRVPKSTISRRLALLEQHVEAIPLKKGPRSRILWATADLTEDKLAGLAWSTASETEGSSVLFTPNGCPIPGTLTRDGWTLAYETTPTDGFRVMDVLYNGVTMIHSIKLVEWHVQCVSTGFMDFTGCGGQSGGNFIAPYGETQVQDLLDAGNNVIGFELIQDFRMGNWGQTCNYRYDQHLQFFTDGRFRVVQGAFWQGVRHPCVLSPRDFDGYGNQRTSHRRRIQGLRRPDRPH